MKMTNLFSIAALILISGPMVFAAEDQSSKIAKAVARSGLKETDLGIVVLGPDDKEVYVLNPDKRFIPASITKLFTAAAVLHELKPGFEFQTQIVYKANERIGKVLKGSLCLKGGGDPAFVSERMWMLVNDFLRTDITSVEGDLLVDDSFFDQDRIDEGREPGRNDRAYDAPVGALSFNWNSTTVYVRPSHSGDGQARAWVDPENGYVQLVNNAKTGRSTNLQVSRVAGKSQDRIVVDGTIGANESEKHFYKNISDPALYAGHNLVSFLRQRGITVSGQVRRSTCEAFKDVGSTNPSLPMSKLVSDMNKFSNNFVGEMLAKGLAATKTGKQGTMAMGLRIVQDFLQDELDFKKGEYVLANVSGFSRDNSFAPRHFIKLLNWVENDFRIYPEFLQSLPISGTDGTLEKRMNGETKGWVRAKTGLLTGVSSLSGFAGRPKGGVFAFAFMYNGGADGAKVRAFFDKLTEILIK
ncbi:MAG: D-alanyl-D-alanine carboxypeptidase/D-alanyl-D-alanine-endopeptidase [Oligoflexia bacterium]|nr:D-alanyl-D-alanine carboxypeptidase/D-alanyl-D-alanine-endopeptidase [Oligoflexia bacterium]